MLKICDGQIKVPKTEVNYHIVINAINEGVDPDSAEMETIFRESAKLGARLERLAARVALHGTAMNPFLIVDIEQFEKDCEKAGYDYTESKLYLKLQKYLRKANWHDCTHRDFKAIYNLKEQGFGQTESELAEYNQSLYERLLEVYRPYSIMKHYYGRRLGQKNRRRFANRVGGTLAVDAKFFAGLAPVFINIALISREYCELVETLSGPLQGLGRGSLVNKINAAIMTGLNGTSTVNNVRGISESLQTLMVSCIKAIPMLSSPYIVPLAMSIRPIADSQLTPNLPFADANGCNQEWIDFETDYELGGLPGALIQRSYESQLYFDTVYKSALEENPATDTRKFEPYNLSVDDINERIMNTHPLYLPLESITFANDDVREAYQNMGDYLDSADNPGDSRSMLMLNGKQISTEELRKRCEYDATQDPEWMAYVKELEEKWAREAEEKRLQQIEISKKLGIANQWEIGGSM
jgi:hypothetical protein